MNNKIRPLTVQLIFRSILLLIIFCFSLQDIGAQEKSKQEIKVMTFNIRYGTANDGENSWQFRKDNVFEELKKQSPDLLGLQEALTFQIKDILKALPEYAFAGVGRDDGKQAGEYSCILYRKRRIKLDSTETFWFSDTPDVPGSKHWGNNITRICTWIRVTDRLTGKHFYHYNLHIDHLSQPSRERSTELLIKKIKSQPEQLPVIITGDFNSGEENQAIKNILQSGMIDSHRLLHGKDPNEGTFNEFKGITTGEKIDFIFITKEFQAKESEIIHTNVRGKYLSDHFPVFAQFLVR
jgi:endonuclease/exonuclease/phosphatase family metal-dependent hydrolase